MSKFGLKKSDKILKRSDFVLLSKDGKQLQDNYFIFVYMPGGCKRSRLGITVSKRVGNAVSRNRLKRLIREWFRKNRARMRKSWDINIIAKKSAVELTSRQVNMSLGEGFTKIEEQYH